MDSRKRSIVKALTYRAVSSSILALVTWMFTSNLVETSTITIIYNAGTLAFYYLHERMWSKVQWGTVTIKTNIGIPQEEDTISRLPYFPSSATNIPSSSYSKSFISSSDIDNLL
jgi:uncharacterized membrane protein